MRGGIYSYQKCHLCGSSFQYSIKSGGMICPFHPEQRAHGDFVVRFGRNIRKRFSSFSQAERFLIGLRYEVDRGTFDPRDYQSGNPLGFSVLAEKWLTVKSQEVKPSSFDNLERFMKQAMRLWENRNIKEIAFADIEDFILSYRVSSKTKSNIRSCLHTFWKWLVHRQVITIAQMPEFPDIKFKLGFRKIIDKKTQRAILNEVYRISYHINPRIWIGIKWLCTYISIRPGELLKMQEQDVNSKIGVSIVRHTKEGYEKVVPMLDTDQALVDQLPTDRPDLPFFRHAQGISGCQKDQPFGQKYLYKWWKKACVNLGVEGIDLYGGTRHSSATALKDRLSPEQIKAGTMHATNRAFERYFQRNNQDAIAVYSLTDPGHQKQPCLRVNLSK